LRVDPRPLLSMDALLDGNSEEAFLGVPQSVLDSRMAVLRSIPVKTIDAAAVNQNAKCPSAFRGADSSGADPHAGCPKEDFFVLAIGLPRPGTATIPTGGAYRRDVGAAIGSAAVLVVQTNIGPGGASVTILDCVLKRAGPGWEFVTCIPLSDID